MFRFFRAALFASVAILTLQAVATTPSWAADQSSPSLDRATDVSSPNLFDEIGREF